MNDMCVSTEFGLGGAWLAEYTLQTLDAGVLFFDRTGHAVQWNATAARLLGVTEEQLAGRRLDDPLWSPATMEGEPLTEFDNPVRRTLDAADQVLGETIAVRYSDGSEVWLSVNALPVFGADRGVRGVLVSLVSIAGGAQVSDVLAAAVHCGRAAFEHSMTAHIVVDRSGRVVDWNRTLSDLVDRPDIELVGSGFELLCDVELDWLWADGVVDGNGKSQLHTHLFHSNGTRVPVLAHFTLVNWPGSGRAVMVQCLETGLFAQIDRPPAPQGVASYVPVKLAMLVVTIEGIIVEVNPFAARLFGRDTAELIQEPLDHHVTFFPPGTRSSVPDASRSTTPMSFGSCSVRRSDGSSVMRECFISRLDGSRSLMLVQLTEPTTESSHSTGERSSWGRWGRFGVDRS